MRFRLRHIANAADASQRGGVYRLLGRIWLCEVDAPLLADLSRGEVRQTLRALGGDALTPDPHAIDDLSADYCQLFVGPSKHFPPYQSVWSAGRFEGEPTSDMRELGEALDYRPPTDADVMPDHLGAQLDVMGVVLQRWAALPTNEEQADALLELATMYPLKHLAWCLEADLFREAQQRANTDFYRGFIQLTRDFLTEELVAAELDQERVPGPPDPAG